MPRALWTVQIATSTYTTGEAAAKIGISRQTLQTWIAARKITSPEPINVGKLTVRLWTDSDVEAARQSLNPNRPGPKPTKLQWPACQRNPSRAASGFLRQLVLIDKSTAGSGERGFETV